MLVVVIIGGKLFARIMDVRVGVGVLWLVHVSFCEYDTVGDGGSHGSAQRELADLDSDGVLVQK